MAQGPKTSAKTIYDFGANNGDDISYYLKKCDVVVAVEANTVLCEKIKGRFSHEIRSGRLFVENCVLTNGGTDSIVSFYLHKTHHVLSQFPRPSDESISDFEEVLLPAKSVLELIEKYGEPLYVKIDIEHYDEEALRALFSGGIFPPFISAEAHSVEVFAALVSIGRYNSFKLVDGQTVSKKYQNHRILSRGVQEEHSFPYHSAGPFGEDLDGSWLSADDFLLLLAYEGLGWKDIHATNIIEPEASSASSFSAYARRAVMMDLYTSVKLLVPAPVRRTIRRAVKSLR